MDGAGRWFEAGRLTRFDSSRRMPDGASLGRLFPECSRTPRLIEAAGIEPAELPLRRACSLRRRQAGLPALLR